MSLVHLTIDGKKIAVAPGTTILKAAQEAGIFIPTLCYLEGINEVGACHMCSVEIEGEEEPQPACITPVREGMVVHTDTSRIRKMREALQIRLRLAKAQAFSARDFKVDRSDSAIIRDPNKCIACLRCESVCHKMQTVGAIALQRLENRMVVAPIGSDSLAGTPCVQCGQCTHVCLTGALAERDQTAELLELLEDKGKHVVIQTSPASRVSLGEMFFLSPGEDVTGRMVAALRRLGFAKVFDTTLGADITAMEEAREFQDKLQKGRGLPHFTSCCGAWVRFVEQFYPQLVENLSSCKSPQQMLGALIKAYYAPRQGLDPGSVVVVSLTPCTSKKGEALRLKNSGHKDVDLVLTMREMGRLLRSKDIDLETMPEEDFDSPFGPGSGGGQIFGASGGVATSLLRTLGSWEGVPITELNWRAWAGEDLIQEALVNFKGKEIRALRVQTLGKARLILDKLASGELGEYHLVEVMACPGGCIGGGGQPIPSTQERLEARAEALKARDGGKAAWRLAQENPQVQEIYSQFLENPGSPRAKELLHTFHASTSPRREEAQAQKKRGFLFFGR
ncbi:MAG TPA: 2Fe-2S iron-sulfur cluster binding domain-containing protein [Moorella mulderi]|nr:2Fe-2S iron-sulfur cluster binding domain-containing protein [Moorella mulderi]